MNSVELNKLYNRYCEDKLAHAFLLETNNIELCFDDVLLFIKMINCPKTFDENCNFSKDKGIYLQSKITKIKKLKEQLKH